MADVYDITNINILAVAITTIAYDLLRFNESYDFEFRETMDAALIIHDHFFYTPNAQLERCE